MSQAMERALVAELIVISVQGRRRGSGYRVAREAVLTAAHVLDGAVSVEVRFEPDLPGQWVTTAVSWWADSRSDVALLLISPRTEGEASLRADFGRLGASPSVLDVQAVGFPRWKLRTDAGTTGAEAGRYRDACHAVGSVATLSNWREGTLEVALSFAPTPDGAAASPWEGMSGAALWAGNRIVGVISKHHPGDGLSTLAAARIDRALEVADPPVRQALRNVVGLPEQAEQLPCVVPAVTGHEDAGEIDVCPYPTDMAAFRPEQAEWFFGREQLTAQLVERLDHALVHGGGPLIVVAPSGAGKSSLLQAGLLPKLGEAVLPGSPTWPHVLLTPTDDPMMAITTKLAALISDESTTVATQLAEAPDRFVERLHQVLLARRDSAEETRPRLMLIVDQLEELFTMCADKRERQRFLDLISRLADTTPCGHDPVALVVYGLRADFYARCADHGHLRAALQGNQLVVGPMSQGELRDAIRRPAEHAGLDVEANLVEVMLRDLGVGPHTESASDGGYEAGRLPLLAHALRATWRWRDRQRNTLTLAGYETTGGIQKAVEITADGVYNTLDEDERKTARALFLRLVRLGGDDADDTRRRVPRTELLRGVTDLERTHKVLAAFTQARLLTQYQDTVEITHEALLRAWSTLRHWIDNGRSANLIRQELDDAAQVWERHGRRRADLFRGSRLSAVREGINETDLSPLGAEFLAASLQHERSLAASRRRRMLTGWGAAALVAVLAAGLGIQLRITENERDNANFHQITGQADRVRASNPSLAAQLDLTAHLRRPDDPHLRSNLLNTKNVPLVNPLRLGDAVSSVALSADGNLLAASSGSTDGDGEVRLWDVSDAAEPTPLSPPLPHKNSTVELSADGDTLAISRSRGQDDAHGGGMVQLWDVSKPAQPRRLGPPLPDGGSSLSTSAALSGDGGILVISSGHAGMDPEGVMRLWDVSQPEQPEPLSSPIDTMSVGSVDLSADGKTLLSSHSTNNGEVRLWDVSNPAQPHVFNEIAPYSSAYLGATALSADGTTFVTGSGSGDEGVRLWDSRARTHRDQPLPEGVRASEAALSADGGTLVTSDGEGDVLLWNMPVPSLPLGALPRHVSRASLALSADGHTLATGDFVGDDPAMQLWNVSDPARPQRLGPPLWDIESGGEVALSGDGTILATSSERGVRLLNVSDPAHPRHLGAPLLDVEGGGEVALNADGTILATSIDKQRIQLWDVSDPDDPQRLGPQMFSGNGKYLASVALSADGNTLATSGGGDHGVLLWDLSDPTSPKRLVPRLTDVEGGSGVALSADGTVLATKSVDQGIQLWDVSDPDEPQRLGPSVLDTEGSGEVALAADGDTIATIGGGQYGDPLATGWRDNWVQLWDLNHIKDRICRASKNSLGRSEWHRHVPGQEFSPPCV